MPCFSSAAFPPSKVSGQHDWQDPGPGGMKRPHASTDLTDAEEAGLAGMEPLTSMPAELGMQGFPSGGQMCIGDAGLGNLSMPGQEGFLSSVSSSAGGLEGHATFPDGAFDPGTVPWRKLPTCHGAMLLGGAPGAAEREDRVQGRG